MWCVSWTVHYTIVWAIKYQVTNLITAHSQIENKNAPNHISCTRAAAQHFTPDLVNCDVTSSAWNKFYDITRFGSQLMTCHFMLEEDQVKISLKEPGRWKLGSICGCRRSMHSFTLTYCRRKRTFDGSDFHQEGPNIFAISFPFCFFAQQRLKGHASSNIVWGRYYCMFFYVPVCVCDVPCSCTW